MLCEKCKNKKPTVFFTDTGGINHSLCAACASLFTQASVSVSTAEPSPELIFIPKDCISSGTLISPHAPTSDNITCEVCGMTYNDTSIYGKFFCPACAACIMKNEMPHKKRIPRKIRLLREKQQNIASLKKMLENSISREDYEKAASIRDKIRKLEAAE